MIRDHMVYLVTVAHLNGPYVKERDECDMDYITTLNDIADGQFAGLAQVIEINPAEHSSRDVTEDFAQAVSDIWADQGEPLLDWQREFVEAHLGVSFANQFAQAAE
jgi:hypothetical protein